MRTEDIMKMFKDNIPDVHVVNPRTGKEKSMIKQGKLRGEKVKFSKDNIDFMFWYPFVNADGHEYTTGVCFSVKQEDVDDLISLLVALKDAEIKE